MQIVGYALIGIVLTVGLVVVSALLLSEDAKPDIHEDSNDN